MIKALYNAVNAVLKLVGLKLVSSQHNLFLMTSALKRLKNHDFDFNSIIDIGASNGSWCLEIMKYYPDKSILAIEPLTERHSDLTSLAQKYPKFSYEPCVAGDSNIDDVTLMVTHDLDGSTVGGTTGESRTVQQKTLDSIIENRNLAGPFLLKFDTHGFEENIINGARDTLKNTNVIIMEVYNYHITERSLLFSEICHLLSELGFRCYDMVDPMLRKHDDAFWQMDLFFCREDSELFSYNQYN